MDSPHRRELHNGFGDAMARAFELAVTPAIFGFLGHLLDGAVGTAPLFLVLFALVSFGYIAWKMVNVYDRRMREHEATLGLPPRGGPPRG